MDLKKVERVYTSYAGVYDQIFGKVFHEGRESAIRNLNVQPDEHILEVGVGTGLALRPEALLPNWFGDIVEYNTSRPLAAQIWNTIR